MRSSLVGFILLSLAGCGSSNSLVLTPSGTVTVSGPTEIKAGASAQWSLTGPGSLDSTFGTRVTYLPPAVVNGATPPQAVVTATANGQTASVTLTVKPTPRAPGVIPGISGDITVVYDPQQIPHVFCKALLDCITAQGYLHAQDRLFQMDFFRRAGHGTLATLLGPQLAGQDKQILTVFVTRDGKRIEDVLAASIDANTKAMLQAYASGVNAYLAVLAAHPALLSPEYAQVAGPPVTPGDIAPWTIEDTLAIARLQQFQLSETIEKETAYGLFASVYGPGGAKQDLAKFAAWVRPQQPLPGFTLSTTDGSPVIQRNAPKASSAPVAQDLASWAPSLAGVADGMRELQPLFGTLALGAGSNNWVVDGAHSANGHAMVANDPHLPLQYPPLFHLSVLTASDSSGLNLQGATFPGIPGALIGRGAHVGWGVTVVGYDVTDLYTEILSACGTSPVGFCVTFNSAAVPIVPVQYQLAIRGQSGTTPVTVLIVPHHGPIVSFDPAHLKAVSMRWTGHEVTNDVRAFFGLNNASAVGDTSEAAGTAFGALHDYATGAQNFVLADDAGHIGFDPHALVPRRKWLEDQVAALPTTPAGPFPWFPMPGQGSAEWGSGTAGDNCAGTGANLPAAACWVPDTGLPRGVDPAKGYLATANSDPAGYTASPAAPFLSTAPAGLYPYLSFDWDDPTDVRYARIAELLAAKTSSAAKMSVADMQAVQSDHMMLLAKLFAPFPSAGSGQPASYPNALALMNTWAGDNYDCPTGLTSADPKSAADPDPVHNRDSAACFLFHVFLRDLLTSVFDDDLAVVSSVTGSSFGGNAGAEIRGMLYLLTLPDNSAGADFCNDVDGTGATVATHSCKEKVVSAMGAAYDSLSKTYGAQSNWLWGRVHTLSTKSPGDPIVQIGLGPFARPGGALTVDVASPEGSGFDFHYGHGSNVRFIAEMTAAASANTKMQLPGPQVDGLQRPGTTDLLGLYVNNQYFDFAHDHEVDAQTASVQVFTAQ